MSTRMISAMVARLGDRCSGSSTRWKVKRTASALKGSPSWKITPRRRRSCQVLSSRSFHDSASWGTMRWSASRPTRESKMLTPTVARIEDRFMVGSRFSGVHGMATLSSPWGCAPAGTPGRIRRTATVRAIQGFMGGFFSARGLRGGDDGLEVFLVDVERKNAAGSDDHSRARRLGDGIGDVGGGRGRAAGPQRLAFVQPTHHGAPEAAKAVAQGRRGQPVVPVHGGHGQGGRAVEVNLPAVDVEHGPHGAGSEALQY